MAEETFHSSPSSVEKVPENWSFEYRGIAHVGYPRVWEEKGGRDAFVASIIDKYKVIDVTPPGVKPDFYTKDLAPKDKDLKATHDVVDVAKENDRLKAELKSVEAKDEIEQPLGLTEPVSSSSEVTEESLTGPGECPYCHRNFKRRDMHVPRCQEGPTVTVVRE